MLIKWSPKVQICHNRSWGWCSFILVGFCVCFVFWFCLVGWFGFCFFPDSHYCINDTLSLLGRFSTQPGKSAVFHTSASFCCCFGNYLSSSCVKRAGSEFSLFALIPLFEQFRSYSLPKPLGNSQIKHCSGIFYLKMYLT